MVREELHAYSEHIMSYKLLITQPQSEQDLLSGYNGDLDISLQKEFSYLVLFQVSMISLQNVPHK